MKKTLAALVVGGALIVGSAGVASAGEWNPARGYIHVDEDGEQVRNPARSECSYSGLDDPDQHDPPAELLPSKGRVQSPGQFVAAFGSEMAGIPGMACRGNVHMAD